MPPKSPRRPTDDDEGNSDHDSLPSLHSPHDSIELQKIRTSADQPFLPASDGDSDSESEEESDKEHARPITRIGSSSKSFTEEEERAVIRKFDRRLAMFLALLYLLSFFDRSSKMLHFV